MDGDTLIEMIRKGDANALTALMQFKRTPLIAFIDRKLGSALKRKIEPDDLFQNLSMKALAEFPSTDLSTRDPFGWLCQLAEQCIVDDHRYFSAEKRDSRREIAGNVPVGEASQDLVALLAASITSPTQAVVRNERQRKIDAAIASLTPEQREALTLRYVQGLSTKEVATHLNKAEVATRVMLSRLVQKLQETLNVESNEIG
jgi:RNA polymerase sigma-70 factor, ECF subfamily